MKPVLSKKRKKANKSNKPKLTVKQKKFADEYIKTGNATQSAITAGYSKKTARAIGQENLTKLDIKRYIDAQMQKIEDAKIMKADEALQGIAAIARGELTTYGYTSRGEEIEIPPTITERQRAYESILRRFPLSALDKAQIKKAQAEAVKAEAEAQVAKAQAEQLHTVTDKVRDKMDQLSTEDLRKLAKLTGDEDNA